MQWLALLIPFVLAVIYKVFFHEDFNWLEFAAALLISVLTIFAFTAIYTHSIAVDRKLVSGYVVGKQFIPEHEVTICLPVSCGEDCTTIQCHQQTIPDDYDLFIGAMKPNIFEKKKANYNGELYGTKGKSIDISKERYYNLVLGDTAAWIEQYQNNLKKSKTSLYRELKDKRYPYIHMPKIYDAYKVTRIIDLRGASLETSVIEKLSKINSSLNYLNINIGVIITTYPDEFVKYTENYWLGGNQNDFVTIIGVDANDNISYVDSIVWGNEYLKIKVKDTILDNVKSIKELSKIIDILYETVKEVGFKEMDFSKFNYLKVQFPFVTILWLYLTNIFVTIIVLEIFRRNEY